MAIPRGSNWFTMPVLLLVWIAASIAFVLGWRASATSPGPLPGSLPAAVILCAPGVALFATLLWRDGRRAAAVSADSSANAAPPAQALRVPQRFGMFGRVVALVVGLLLAVTAWIEATNGHISWTIELTETVTALVCFTGAFTGRFPKWFVDRLNS